MAEPRGGESLRPSNHAVPSYRPPQDSWLSVMDSPVSAGLGGGAAHATGGDHRRVCRRQSGGPSNRQGSGINGLGVPWRAQPSPGKASSLLTSGSSLGCPVRRRAHPLRSRRSGGTSPDRTPPCACADSRPPGPVDAPGRAALCPCQVCSPHGSAASGPGDCDATSAWPLQKQPTCGAHGRCLGPRCPSVSRLRPCGIAPGGPTRRSPAGAEPVRGGGVQKATRG
jgi:hypothetical protein